MRFGYWLPVFGGWLRNVDDEGMAATWEYVEPARAAQRGARVRPHARRRAQPQRHQGHRRALARRLEHGRGAGRGDRTARDHGGGAADVSCAGAARQAGGQHRSHQQRAAVAERRVVVVGGRSAHVRRAVRPARRSLRPDRRMARRSRWLVAIARASRIRASYYTVDDAVLEPKPVRRRGRPIYAGGESPAAKALIAAQMRRVADARRSAGRHRTQGR